MLSLRAFMFERVYLAPVDAARARAGARGRSERIYEHLAARGDSQDAIVEFIAGMTDRFALSYAERLI